MPHLTQTEFATWAQQHRANAPRTAKRMVREADQAEAIIADKGCSCDPSITFRTGANGAPDFTTLQITHSFICTNPK